MLTFDKVKTILIDELRARGYNPNPADVTVATTRIIELSKEPEDVVEPPKASKPPKS